MNLFGEPVSSAQDTYWDEKIEQLLANDEEFLTIYKKFVSSPWKNGRLEPKVKELLNIAISASPTHLYEAATRTHIQKALALGATEEEIAEVLKVVSILGVHTCAVGIPIMMQHFRDSEQLMDISSEIDERQQIKERFIETMGYWNQFRDDLIQMDTPFFQHYYEFLTEPMRRGILEPKVIEFIYIAIDSSTTHLFEKGIEVHIKNALKYGATQGELLEVFQLTSALGFHTLLMGLPILKEEIQRQKKLSKG
ncbi:carboxymuconolactone decarboxylase family protein [Psychrobacillus sp. NPDC096426]|uniref:carboxymuconolactone decarboxylase family protein n=1 Tax=Psychrobacillus sp. NPDC096426 TaxID=3364491 RepID=UPI003802BC32